jgi:hypothetical protein
MRNDTFCSSDYPLVTTILRAVDRDLQKRDGKKSHNSIGRKR